MTERTWHGIVYIACSLDGFIARRNGDVEWLIGPRPKSHTPQLTTDAAHEYDRLISKISHIVMGRATYEKVLAMSEAWPYPKPVIVLSSTLPETAPHVTVARTVADVTNILDAAPATGVYVDGGQVIQEFLRRDLIDELTVTQVPHLLGDGLRLFGEHSTGIELELAEVNVIEDGMVSVQYRVAR